MKKTDTQRGNVVVGGGGTNSEKPWQRSNREAQEEDKLELGNKRLVKSGGGNAGGVEMEKEEIEGR